MNRGSGGTILTAGASRFRLWVALAAGLFLLGMVLGLTVRGPLAGFLTQEIAALKELSSVLVPFQVSTAVFIFVKNITTVLLSFVLSPIFCLAPMLGLLLNGWLLALVGAMAMQQRSLGFVLAAVLPHGVIEIPALIIGEAAAISFGVAVMMAVVSAKGRELLVPRVKRDIKYLAISCILLAPAAVIETYVTPLLVR